MIAHDPPDVTVIIPTKDRYGFLSRALDSVFAQEGVATEVIVVDDGSSEETAHFLGELADPRLRVLRNASSAGVAAARNRGIGAARGRWLAFLDDDDLWAPRKLRLQLDRASGGASFVYCGVVAVGDPDGPTEIAATDPGQLRDGLLEYNLVGSPSTVMVRTGLVRRAGGFDEGMSVLADWDLWIRVLLDGEAKAAACPEPLVAYVKHRKSMHRVDADAILAELCRLSAKHGRTIGGPRFFRWVANSHRSSGRRWPAARTYTAAALRYRSLGDLARAVGILLGERVMSVGRRPAPPAAEPDWLRVYVGRGALSGKS